MGNEKRDELDQLIDSAMAEYADAEPLAGLEERVLERVRLERAGKRSFWRWSIAVVAVAAALLVILVPRPQQVDVRRTARSAEVREGPPPAANHATPPRARPQTSRSPQHRMPKRDQFPTPAPLTAEERALLHLARFHSDELQPTRELQPIEIAPIEIAPIRFDEDR